MDDELCPDLFDDRVLKPRIQDLLIRELDAAGLPRGGYSAYLVGALTTPFYTELSPIQIVVCLNNISAHNFNQDIGQYLKQLEIKSLDRPLEFAFQNGIIALGAHPAVYDIVHASWFKNHDPEKRLLTSQLTPYGIYFHQKGGHRGWMKTRDHGFWRGSKEEAYATADTLLWNDIDTGKPMYHPDDFSIVPYSGTVPPKEVQEKLKEIYPDPFDETRTAQFLGLKPQDWKYTGKPKANSNPGQFKARNQQPIYKANPPSKTQPKVQAPVASQPPPVKPPPAPVTFSDIKVRCPSDKGLDDLERYLKGYQYTLQRLGSGWGIFNLPSNTPQALMSLITTFETDTNPPPTQIQTSGAKPSEILTVTSINRLLSVYAELLWNKFLLDYGVITRDDNLKFHVNLLKGIKKHQAYRAFIGILDEHPYPNPPWHPKPSFLPGRPSVYNKELDKLRIASAFISDVRYKDLPSTTKQDVDQFLDCNSDHEFPQYGMVVEELIHKADPHNLKSALDHISGDPKKLAKEVNDRSDKYILMMNDRIIDGHHFLAKAKKGKVTRSLKVLDLTAHRFQ